MSVPLPDFGPSRPAWRPRPPGVPTERILFARAPAETVFVGGGPTLGPIIPNPFDRNNLPAPVKDYVEGIFSSEVDKPGQGQVREEVAESVGAFVFPKKFVKVVLSLLGSDTPTGAGADLPHGPDLTPTAPPAPPKPVRYIREAVRRAGGELTRGDLTGVGHVIDSGFADRIAAENPPDP